MLGQPPKPISRSLAIAHVASSCCSTMVSVKLPACFVELGGKHIIVKPFSLCCDGQSRCCVQPVSRSVNEEDLGTLFHIARDLARYILSFRNCHRATMPSTIRLGNSGRPIGGAALTKMS